MHNDNNNLDIKVVVPLKYLSKFWRSHDFPLINYEIELDLSWSKNFIILEILNTPEIDVNPVADLPIAHAIVTSSTKIAAAVTLSINDNIKFLEDLKQ